MTEFHFLRPFWLLALIPLALLSWRLFRLGSQGGDWRRVCDPALLPHILVHDGGGQPARRASLLFSLGGVLAILALAGPVWERLPAPAFRNDAALVIALDLSRSMDAADLKPSRLERARFKIADILKQRKDGLTALLVYAGDAFMVTPLTDDAATINSQLSALSTDLMPAQGSRPERALELAGRLLKQAGLTRGDVLLITADGSSDKGSDAAQALRGQGYRVSVLGVGGEEGAPVPLPDGGFWQDKQGNIIVSKLAAPTLRELAEAGGGVYRKLAADNSDLSALQGFFGRQAQADDANAAGNGVTIEQWEERGPWLLLPLLPIAALAFRRGFLAVLLLLILPLPRPAQALEWQDLWQTRDQRGSVAFQVGDHAKAAETFDNPAWKAASLYKAGQYEEAAQALQGQSSADAQYNLGNALAKQGRYKEALAAYEQALKLDPKSEDARANKEVVEKAMKEQQKQQGKKRSGKDKDKQDEKDKDKDKQDKQDQGEQKDGQNDQQAQDQSEGKQGEQPKDQTGQQDQSPADKEGQKKDQQPAQAQDQPKDESEKKAEAASPRPADKTEAEKAPLADAQEHKSEDQQANEQWLRRIQDDPGGLLRRKFQYQYQQRQGGAR